MSTGRLTKLKIQAYTDKTYNEKDGEDFDVPVNPEQYSQNFKVNYDLEQAKGNQGTDPKFQSTAPEELKLDFVFDSTGTVQNNPLEGMDVADQVDKFLGKVYNMEGEIHKPKFLKIIWGKLNFNCVLTNLDINYTLFKSDGSPLRAKLSCTFTNYVEQVRRVQEEDKSSPDLTHVRTVNDGDHLPLMTYRMYRSSRHYLEVAKANGLVNFRSLSTNKQLVFPPFEKAEA